MQLVFAIFIVITLLMPKKSSAENFADDFLLKYSFYQCSNIDSTTFFQCLQDLSVPPSKIKSVQKLWAKSKENPKLFAFCIAILLGPFGAHRIYLGTSHMVPVAYVLTLGGGLGSVPLIDAILIVTTKNLEKYQNNPRFFMWTSIDEVE